MKLKPLDKKLLIGVDHKDGEQQKVIAVLKDYRIPVLGLEITQKNLENKKLSQDLGKLYWATLKSYYRNMGTTVIALDHPIVDELETDVLANAWYLGRGYFGDLEKFKAWFADKERFIESTNSAIEAGIPLPPAVISELTHKVNGTTLPEFIDFVRPSLILIQEKGAEQITKEFAEITKLRDAHMLSRIRETGVPVAVLGLGHTDQLAESLRDYEHIRLTTLSKEEIRKAIR